MKKLTIAFLSIFQLIFFLGCIPTKFNAQNLEGIFILKDNRKVKIVLEGKLFAYIDERKDEHLPILCCDTLAIGEFEIDNKGFLIVDSPGWLNDVFVDIVVNEKIIAGKDSVTFFISNPIETDLRKFNSEKSDLEYSLLVQPKSGSLDYFKENNKAFDENEIIYYNPRQLPIADFTIMIRPKSSIYIRDIQTWELHSLEYKVKNPGSNSFEIDIPKLSYGYLSYKRLHGEYVKIVNKDLIVWEGKEFVRSKN